MAATPPRKTCDACRRRKTKCSSSTATEVEAREPCKSCIRLEIPCTFDYVHKRGGRPLGSRDKTTRKRTKRKSDGGRSTGSPSAEDTSSMLESHVTNQASQVTTADGELPTIVNGIGNSSGNYIQYQPDVSANAVNILAAGSAHLHPTTFLDNTEPQSIFASGIDASATAAPEVPAPFGMVLPPPHTSQPHPTSITQDFIAPLNGANVFSPQSELSSGTQINTGGESSSDARKRANQSHWRFTPNSNRLSRPSERFYTALRPPELDIEDVTDWSTVTFFTSLYLKYNHALCPILHKPTFAHDLATRRDKTDRQFRSMLLGLGQSPITRMDGDFTRRELEVIQDRCHRASLLLHDYTYRSPELNTVATLIYAHLHCQCNSDYNRAALHLASACELAQIMKLDDTSISSNLSQDFRERELRKRVYWYLYAVDTTSACAGLPVHIIPTSSDSGSTFPLGVDDELITTQGAFSQPSDKVSMMTGFVAMVKLHIITGEALRRRRSSSAGHALSPSNELSASMQWIASAENRIDEVQAGLPYQLAPVQAWQPSSNENDKSLYGMQRANILITALAAKFLLFDYKQDLFPGDLATIERRDAVAREGVQTITSIPQDDLASNGESMRGKVFRILLALMSRSISEGIWGRTLQEWWDLYMNIQFVSIASPDITSVLPSRDPTPNL